MPTYDVKFRRTGPLTVATVTASTREAAIQQVMDDTADDETIEVFDVPEAIGAIDNPAAGATGVTGATGPVSRRGEAA